jgi:hypothetical protein
MRRNKKNMKTGAINESFIVWSSQPEKLNCPNIFPEFGTAIEANANGEKIIRNQSPTTRPTKSKQTDKNVIAIMMLTADARARIVNAYPFPSLSSVVCVGAFECFGKNKSLAKIRCGFTCATIPCEIVWY